jgi:cytochrome c556
MPNTHVLASLSLGMVLAATAIAAGAEGETLLVRPEMQQGINSATMDVWEIGNGAMDDNGGIDPKLMDDAKWTKLADAADRLANEARLMQHAEVIRAAAPAEAGEVELGTYSLKDVQGYIDADPDAFRAMAAALADHAAQLAAAARARDPVRAGGLVGGIDSVCEACHAKYWYPQG